jgi:hypothetical protein
MCSSSSLVLLCLSVTAPIRAFLAHKHEEPLRHRAYCQPNLCVGDRSKFVVNTLLLCKGYLGASGNRHARSKLEDCERPSKPPDPSDSSQSTLRLINLVTCHPSKHRRSKSYHCRNIVDHDRRPYGWIDSQLCHRSSTTAMG